MDKRRINVRAIIWNNGKLLAVKHKAADGSTSPYYAVPGGGLDPQESLIDGVKRELLEETGVAARVGRLLFIQQFASKRFDYEEELEFFFLIENPEDFRKINLEDTSHGHLEIALCEFIDPRGTTILPEFLGEIDLENYVETEQPTAYFDNFNE